MSHLVVESTAVGIKEDVGRISRTPNRVRHRIADRRQVLIGRYSRLAKIGLGVREGVGFCETGLHAHASTRRATLVGVAWLG